MGSIDTQRITARDTQLSSVLLLQRSVRRWLNRTFEREDQAARRIQRFARYILYKKRIEKSLSQVTVSTNSTVNSDDDMHDALHYQYEVLLWHGSQLGVGFYECSATGYPCVQDADGNDALPGMCHLRTGDYLISINDVSTNRRAIGYTQVMAILDSGVRPAVLRFRRPNARDLRRHSTRFSRYMSRANINSSIARQTRQKLREKLESSLCYVIWREEDGPLGLGLIQDRSNPYPAVAVMKEYGVVAREEIRNRLSLGDLLLSINNFDVSTLPYQMIIQTLQYAPKPLVLTFRRTRQSVYSERSCEL